MIGDCFSEVYFSQMAQALIVTTKIDYTFQSL